MSLPCILEAKEAEFDADAEIDVEPVADPADIDPAPIGFL